MTQPRGEPSATSPHRTGLSCTHARPARSITINKSKEEKYGNTNWIGCLGRHTETRQGNHETRERRIRRPLFVLVTIRKRCGHEPGGTDRRGGGRLLLNGAFI